MKKPSSSGPWASAVGAGGILLAAFALAVTNVSTSSGSPETLGGVTLEEVRPRVMTPNGDALNDVVYFQFDSSVAGLPIEAVIRDVRGARVAGLELNSSEDALIWDGRDDDGRMSPSGIYIYSIKIGQSHASGTVVIAR
jgi:hypothetical protein